MTREELRAAATEVVAWCSDTPEAALNEEVLAVARALLDRLPAADDDQPADFEWIAAQAERQEDQGYWDIPPSGDVWWEIGPLSFTCESYQSDPGEPMEAVAADWQVDGEALPKAMWPRTRGAFRRLLAALGVPPRPPAGG